MVCHFVVEYLELPLMRTCPVEETLISLAGLSGPTRIISLCNL